MGYRKGYKKVYAYLRRDISDIEREAHEKAAKEWAKEQGFQVDVWLRISRNPLETKRERKAVELEEKIPSGSILVVPELSWLGRSLLGVVQAVNEYTARGVRVVALKEGIDTEEVNALSASSFFSLLSSVENDVKADRAKHTAVTAQVEGKRRGKPKGTVQKSKLDAVRSMIVWYLRSGVSKTAIARMVGCSRQTLTAYVKNRLSNRDLENPPKVLPKKGLQEWQENWKKTHTAKTQVKTSEIPS